jgi:hypothetical protein
MRQSPTKSTELFSTAPRNESLGLPAEIQRVMNSPTGIEMIEAFVSMQARGNPAVWAVARAIDAVRRTDAAAARAWQSRLESRLAGCRVIVSRLKAEGSLRPGLAPSIAADLLWTMTSLRMWEDLVLEREWSPEQYQGYLTNVLIGALTSSRSGMTCSRNGIGSRERDSTIRRRRTAYGREIAVPEPAPDSRVQLGVAFEATIEDTHR